MTETKRQARLRAIIRCAEGPDIDHIAVAQDDEVVADVKRGVAAAVGRWVAYRRGLAGSG